MTNTRIDRLIDVLGRIEQLLQSQTRPAGIESHYTPPQIANALGVDPATVLGWIHSGKLQARRLGQGVRRPRYRVALSAIDRFLESREVTPPKPQRRQRRHVPAEIDYVAMMNLDD